LGAASLARALDLGLGAKPIIVTEDRNAGPVAAAIEASGISLLPPNMAGQRPHAGVLEIFPLGREHGQKSAHQLFDRYRAKAVIFVEKAGPNSKGIFHSILGYGRDPEIMANAHFLVEEARERGVLTIGIGDGGNEIGFGKIQDAVREIQPFGEICRCPCQGGIATVSEFDVLVSSAISNWGAYGVAACLAVLQGNPDLVQDEETERLALQSCVLSGGADGVFGSQTMQVDGTPLGVQLAVVRMLSAIVVAGLKTVHRGF
jgi:hypothetical protein